ncbi:MAG: hypothetical protein QM770_18815 [Tepidisphaeraceae bacterium]
MADASFDVKVSVDLSSKLGPFNPMHRFFGCDEPNYASMPAGQRLLGELGKVGAGQPVFFRTHNLFCTGDGKPALKWGSTNLYTEEENGRGTFDFTIIDRIFDAYRDHNVKPYVQLGFMPKALSRKPEPYQHHWTPAAKYDEIYTGWSYPPNDFAKWGEVVFRFTQHLVERYGKAEAETWYWETWNEPNIGYWRGTPAEFHMLHDHAIAAVKHALPTAKVGGPDCAGYGAQWMKDFLAHVLDGRNHATGEKGTPTDFVSFHAKGMPKFVDGHVQMGIAAQLREIENGFKLIAADERTKKLPIVIGESDPEGCAACQGPSLGYRNGTMYSSYTAASFARKWELADRHGVTLDGALTWAFLFEDQPPFAGFRVLASGMVDHAVMNVFRMFGQMAGTRVRAISDGAVALDDIVQHGVRGAKADVGSMATSTEKSVAVLLWHYHDDDLAGPDANVTLSIDSIPSARVRLREQRIDTTHGNAFNTWKAMGEPKTLDESQLRQLQADAALPTIRDDAIEVAGGRASVDVKLPRQGVLLVTVDWA